jgi:hypothetical protein
MTFCRGIGFAKRRLFVSRDRDYPVADPFWGLSPLVCLSASLKAPSQEVPWPRIKMDPNRFVPTSNGRRSVLE